MRQTQVKIKSQHLKKQNKTEKKNSSVDVEEVKSAFS